MSWVALPAGQSIPIRAGFSYAGIVSADRMNDKAQLLDQAAKNGLTVWDYGEYGDKGYDWLGVDPNSDRRRVALAATASRNGGDIPWGLSIPFIVHYNIVSAWAAGPGQLPKGSTSAPGDNIAPLVVAGLAVVGGGAALWWWRKKHRRLKP